MRTERKHAVKSFTDGKCSILVWVSRHPQKHLEVFLLLGFGICKCVWVRFKCILLSTYAFPTSLLRNFFMSSFLQVATDVAVRGLVIPNVDYVINYSYPYTAEDYAVRLNQSGKTGRKGIVHTFFTPAYQVGIHLDMNCQ